VYGTYNNITFTLVPGEKWKLNVGTWCCIVNIDNKTTNVELESFDNVLFIAMEHSSKLANKPQGQHHHFIRSRYLYYTRTVNGKYILLLALKKILLGSIRQKKKNIDRLVLRIYNIIHHTIYESIHTIYII